jgi:hypothetical protein
MGTYTCNLKKVAFIVPNQINYSNCGLLGHDTVTTGQCNFGADTSSTSAFMSQQYIPTVHSTQPVYMVSES